MELTPEVIALGTELTSIAGKGVVSVFDKIRIAKEKGNDKETIGRLEDLINELIQDKNSLITIAQAYKEQIINQTITENEITYITESIIPLLEDILSQTNDGSTSKMQEGISIIKSLLSKETFTIMQILGFNFKEAIGEPLTELVSTLITSKIPNDSVTKLNIVNMERELGYLKICQDPDSYARFKTLSGK